MVAPGACAVKKNWSLLKQSGWWFSGGCFGGWTLWTPWGSFRRRVRGSTCRVAWWWTWILGQKYHGFMHFFCKKLRCGKKKHRKTLGLPKQEDFWNERNMMLVCTVYLVPKKVIESLLICGSFTHRKKNTTRISLGLRIWGYDKNHIGTFRGLIKTSSHGTAI